MCGGKKYFVRAPVVVVAGVRERSGDTLWQRRLTGTCCYGGLLCVLLLGY